MDIWNLFGYLESCWILDIQISIDIYNIVILIVILSDHYQVKLRAEHGLLCAM